MAGRQSDKRKVPVVGTGGAQEAGVRRGGAPSVILSLPIGHSSTHLHAAPITWVGMGVTCVAQVSLSEDRVPSGSRKVDHSLGGPWSHLRPRSWQVYPNILMSLLPQKQLRPGLCATQGEAWS